MRTRRASLSVLLFIVLVMTLLVLPLAACTQAPAPTPTPTLPSNIATLPTTSNVTSAPTPTPTPAPEPEETITTATPTTEISVLVKKVAPAVVRVVTDKGMGSGIIIDKLGYVLTNNHVVEGNQSIKVVLADKREYPALVFGRDEIKDLAILKINAANLPVVTLGNSEKLTPGDEVIAIGYQLDLTGSATISRGIVSAIRIDNEIGLTYIQTDASINPGSSGGAIINSTGEVVGITVSTIRVAGGLPIEGMNFAIAIDSATPIIPKLIAGESVLKPWVTYTDSLHGFTIQYPNTWVQLIFDVSKTPRYQGSVAFEGPGDARGFVIIDSNYHGTLSSRVDTLTDPNAPWQVLFRRDLPWQGIYPACELTYLNTISVLQPDSTILEEGKRLIVIGEGNLYEVYASAPQSEYELYSSTFDTIINSFRLIDSEP